MNQTFVLQFELTDTSGVQSYIVSTAQIIKPQMITIIVCILILYLINYKLNTEIRTTTFCEVGCLQLNTIINLKFWCEQICT